MVSCKSKGQVSLEYLVILGVALFLLVPIMGMFYSSTLESQNLNTANLIILAGRAISSNAENVYYQGNGNKIKVSLNLPDSVGLSTYFNNSETELVVSGVFDDLATDFVFFVDANLTFSNTSVKSCTSPKTNDGSVLGTGPRELFIESCGDYVVVYAYEG